MTDDRERLRTTFDRAAEAYHGARPDYPDELFDSLVAVTALRAGDRVLEIGCGTGKATTALARRGLRVTCVEMGERLAAVARRNVAEFPGVDVVLADFDRWQPTIGRHFDVVVAATAWHWMDPATRYRRAHDLLRPGGHLAFWSATHVLPENGDPFFVEIQNVYDEIGEGLPQGTTFPRPGELPDDRDEIEATGLFGEVVVRQFDWEMEYDADEYLGLLDTFSGHIAMESWKRERLYGEIRRRLARRPGGRVRRHWGAVLHVARRLDGGRPPAP